MAHLVPQRFEDLLRRMLVEHARTGAIYDLEAREIWRGPSPGFDLSVSNHGTRAATGVGPAAGPHAQLAQNMVLAWLGGSRVLELKTIQILDQLDIPRPCIDAQNVGFNVEWSQELTLPQSLVEYAAGWYLVHVAADLLDMPAAARATQLEVSVGYSLAGIQSDAIGSWLRRLRHARPLLDAARASIPGDLRRRIEHVSVPDELFDCVTLSTFHGCPADEIERIAEHLLVEHGAHVVVKMNPTILGQADVDALLRGTLGYDELTVHRPAFDGDPTFDQVVAMMGRLEGVAAARGLSVGAKFTNTLVVENHKTFFPDQKQMYLSGPPLHVLAIHAATRFAEATAGRFQLSFSGGIDRHNFTDALACGLVPVTTCTDLLRPGGYARLPKYMKELEAAMTTAGVRSVDALVRARALAHGGADAGQGGLDLRAAALTNLRAYAARVASDPRYAAPKNRKVPRRVGTHLALLDCVTCDKCVQVCPNDANFAIDVPGGTHEAKDIVLRAGQVRVLDAPVFVVKRDRQFANFVDFCNDCGNCDVFCPEEGGPYKIKARFFGALAGFQSGVGDGFFVDSDALGRPVMWGRIEGIAHHLVVDAVAGRATFTDGTLACGIDLATGRVLDATLSARPLPATPAATPVDGHTLPLWRYHAMRLLLDGTLAGVNPVSARWLDPSGEAPRLRLPLAAAHDV
jgi:putative selenate reductase